MDKELERKLNNIEDKIISLNDRNARKVQFKINTYSMTLGAIIALSITLIIEFIKTIIPKTISTFIGFGLYACVISFVFLWAKSKNIMDIGDFKILGDMNIEKKQKEKFISLIYKNIIQKNKTLNIHNIFVNWEGLNKAGYIYNTFAENKEKKYKYCLKKINKLKRLEIELSSNNSRYSKIIFNFNKNKFAVYLDDRDFTLKDFKEIIKELKKMKTKFNFLNEDKTNIRGL